MIILADSGSTKTEWILMKNGIELIKTETIGLNPYFVDKDLIQNTLEASKLFPYMDLVKEVHFFGAGCSTEDKKLWLESIFQGQFKKAKIEVKTDIEGAVVASSGGEACIVCILGTGSTFRVFNGKEIVRKYSSLGFILGDEGSGTYIAKALLRGIFYQNFDIDLIDAFYKSYPINSEILLERIYKEPQANRYLASFVPFCKEHIAHPQIERLVLNAFEQFYLEHLAKLEESSTYPVHFIGSIALHFEAQLQKIAKKYNFKVGKIIQKPLTQIKNQFSKEG